MTSCSVLAKELSVHGSCMHESVAMLSTQQLSAAYSMSTQMYVKMDADYQLLLSESVCRQLGIVTYHPVF